MNQSASKTLPKKLDVIQCKALRLCCGAMRTTPVGFAGGDEWNAPRNKKTAVMVNLLVTTKFVWVPTHEEVEGN